MVTLKEVAAKAGVSPMTVSRALRDHSEIAKATRDRVRRIAERMGYKMDPHLSQVMTAVRSAGAQRYRETLRFLWRVKRSSAVASEHYLQRFWRGAQARAEELGCRFDEFWLQEGDRDPRRLDRVLRARGIRGLTISPALRVGHLSLPIDGRAGVETPLVTNFASR